MSQENVDAVKAAYAAFSAGDMQGATSAFADDVEWTSPDSLPWGGTQRGAQDIIAAWSTIPESLEDFAVEPLEVIDGGDKVVVLARSSGQANGIDAGTDYAHVFEFRDGKVTKGTVYIDPTATVRAIQGNADA